MKATLALLLSLCLVLVDVSLGDDNGNSHTSETPKVKKCERLIPRLTNLLCVYKCKGIFAGYEHEDDGTRCKFFLFEGKCKNGRCVEESSRAFARSVEPTEEPTEESPEPTEESPVPAEEIPDRVTIWPGGK